MTSSGILPPRQLAIDLASYAPKTYGMPGHRVEITSALERAIKVACNNRETASVFITPGWGTISETFDLRSIEFAGLNIFGPNPSASAVWPSGDRSRLALIEWSGIDGADMFMFARNQSMRGLHLVAEAGKHIRAAVVWDKHPTEGYIGSDLTLDTVGIFGFAGVGLMDYHVLIGPTPGVNNLEFGNFQNCVFDTAQVACMRIQSTTFQSKDHLLFRCGFANGPKGLQADTGSCHVLHCGFSSFTDVAIFASTNDTWRIDTVDSEGCNRFLEYSASSAAGILTVTNCRWSISNLAAADGEWLRLLTPGPFEISNTLWSYDGTYDPNDYFIRAENVSIPAEDTVIFTHNNYFLNGNPVRRVTTIPANPIYWSSINDKYGAPGPSTRIPSTLDTPIP